METHLRCHCSSITNNVAENVLVHTFKSMFTHWDRGCVDNSALVEIVKVFSEVVVPLYIPQAEYGRLSPLSHTLRNAWLSQA